MALYTEAKDTFEGIREWWLPANVEYTPSDVRRASEWLLARGWLRAWEASPGMTVVGPSERFLRSPKAALEIDGDSFA